jgi:hypothetical protein
VQLCGNGIGVDLAAEGIGGDLKGMVLEKGFRVQGVRV